MARSPSGASPLVLRGRNPIQRLGDVLLGTRGPTQDLAGSGQRSPVAEEPQRSWAPHLDPVPSRFLLSTVATLDGAPSQCWRSDGLFRVGHAVLRSTARLAERPSAPQGSSARQPSPRA